MFNKTSLQSKIFNYLFFASTIFSFISCDPPLNEYDLKQGRNNGIQVSSNGNQYYIWLSGVFKDKYHHDACSLVSRDETGFEQSSFIPILEGNDYRPNKDGAIYFTVSSIYGADTAQDTTDNNVHLKEYEDGFLFF